MFSKLKPPHVVISPFRANIAQKLHMWRHGGPLHIVASKHWMFLSCYLYAMQGLTLQEAYISSCQSVRHSNARDMHQKKVFVLYVGT